ncbi:MAG: hypothetical protein ABIJ42_10395 [Acidobacteriota bacterium]
MSKNTTVKEGTFYLTLRLAVLYLLIAVQAISAAVFAAENQQPKKTMPIRATVSVDWDVESGGTRSQGSMNVRMNGTANLAEGVSVMDPAAPPGTIITYAAKGVQANFTYQETVTQDHPPLGCPPLMAEYEGGGVFMLEEFNTPMTSGLNIRKMGSLIPKEMLAFAPPEAKEMMIDYYDFFALAGKQEVRGRKRGWNDCSFTSDSKEINPANVAIRFRITDEGKMTDSRRWTVNVDSGTPSFHIRVSDLPQKIERRSLVPEPDPGGNITYAVNWNFGEVDPYVQIQRKEGEFWIPLPNDVPVEVNAGERMELRGIVLPEEQDPKTGEWTISDDGGSGRKKYIKRFQAGIGEGRVEEIAPQRDLRQPEILFFWVDQGTGKVKYVTRADGQELSAEAGFEIKKPAYQVTVKASKETEIRKPERGIPLDSSECWGAGAHAAAGTNDLWLQYKGIHFEAENLDRGEINGTEQWVQIIKEESYYLKYDDDNRTETLITDALDVCYPTWKGPRAGDAPGIILIKNGDRLTATHDDGTETKLVYTGKTQKNRLYLMFKPEGDGSEWVPVKVVDWAWTGNAEYQSYAADTDTKGWIAQDCQIIPEKPEVVDTAEYPKWDKNSGDGSKYTIN